MYFVMNSGLRTLVAVSISQCMLSERGIVTMEKDSDEDYYDESMDDLVEDMDLDINDDDVNDFLKNLGESKQNGAEVLTTTRRIMS